MLIRSYAPSDEGAVIALWHACGLTRSWNDPAKDIARKLGVQADMFLVGTVDDRLVATVMAGYDGHRGWLNYLAVAPDCRRLGHARTLITQAEAMLIARGCPKVNLQVRTSSAEALAFYRRLGYVQDEVVSVGKRLIADHDAGPR